MNKGVVNKRSHGGKATSNKACHMSVHERCLHAFFGSTTLINNSHLNLNVRWLPHRTFNNSPSQTFVRWLPHRTFNNSPSQPLVRWLPHRTFNNSHLKHSFKSFKYRICVPRAVIGFILLPKTKDRTRRKQYLASYSSESELVIILFLPVETYSHL